MNKSRSITRTGDALPALLLRGWAAAAVVAAAFALGVPVTSASADTTSVTVVGDFQDELGCPGDWDPGCMNAALAPETTTDGVWQGTFEVPAGSWEYKAALNGSWSENYGLNAIRDGANLTFDLEAQALVKFYFDDVTHWITSSRNSVIATAVGDFQSELGCPADWAPDCLRSWLQDTDGDGVYTFSTDALPAGSYEAKVAINEGWTESYGAGGQPGGENIAFTVPAAVTPIDFSYDATTNVLSISGGDTPPADDTTPPRDDTTPPADDTTPPRDDTTPPPRSEFARTLSLFYSKKKNKFKGKLGSQTPACIADQKVKVFKKRKGKDLKLGSATTSNAGRYSLKEKKAKGKFYAQANIASRSTGICLATQSKTVTVGR